MANKSKEFGERLEGLIKKSGLNVNKLAKKTNINPPLIWNYIKLGRIPEAPILYKLAKEFNISMEELLNGKGADTPPPDPTTARANALLSQILATRDARLIDHVLTTLKLYADSSAIKKISKNKGVK